ncbi:ribonuclease H-like domain-containing protein [Tanacetum coccineum]
MAAHIERMERFENAIFKQREEINSRMTEMFRLLKELATSRTSKKILIREKAKFPITKKVNSISMTKEEEEKSDKTEITPNNIEKPTEIEAEVPVKEAETKNGAENEAGNKTIKTPENEEAVEAPGDLKHVNALVDQGSDVNVIPYSTYIKLTEERPAEIDIRLSLASHLYIYPLGIAEDVLVEVAEHVYPIDFVILDIKENEKRLVLEWEEKIKLYLEREMKFNQWRSKNFKGRHPTLTATKEGMEDDGEVTLYLMRRSLKVLRKFHWIILEGRFNQLSHVSSPLLSKPGKY